MTGTAFERPRAASDHEPPGARAISAEASGPRAVSGLVPPSRVPVSGSAAGPAGAALPAGGRVHVRRRLRPSGVSLGETGLSARPSTVPARLVGETLRGPGWPLAAPLREEMQDRLGADFSHVRVHTGATAGASAAELGARAYTVGGHVVIGHGGADKRTLAHELTHVVQQSQGPVAGTDHGSGLRVSDPSDADERAAEANAARVMRGPLTQYRPATPGTGGRSAAAGAARPGRDRSAVGLEVARTGWPSVQRDIENSTFNTKDREAIDAANEFFTAVNDATKAAYRYAVSTPSLGAYVKLDGHTKHWE
ncbi:MAG: DUF4157 domain-containing protein, partial [Trebonia sp.]